MWAPDMPRAVQFFTECVDGKVLSDGHTTQPQPARRVVIRIGYSNVAFIQPDDTASGPLGAFLAKKQNGIYALVWQVADAEKAKAHFTGGQLNLRLSEEDCVSPGFAIHPDDFFGGRHEFVTAV